MSGATLSVRRASTYSEQPSSVVGYGGSDVRFPPICGKAVLMRSSTTVSTERSAFKRICSSAGFSFGPIASIATLRISCSCAASGMFAYGVFGFTTCIVTNFIISRTAGLNASIQASKACMPASRNGFANKLRAAPTSVTVFLNLAISSASRFLLIASIASLRASTAALNCVSSSLVHNGFRGFGSSWCEAVWSSAFSSVSAAEATGPQEKARRRTEATATAERCMGLDHGWPRGQGGIVGW
mmetsp:Transcript_27759/g.62753  ORF Transcript_27759/g.62753 Transcript_27759/m.62753 type:complete len:242 (+) Transcript_27759:733-1458(+)